MAAGSRSEEAEALITRPRATATTLDLDSRAWLDQLRGDAATREAAASRLHAVLLRATRFHITRRGSLAQLRGEGIDELAIEAADDALLAVLARLDDFRGESRFTTWASSFAIFAAGVALRRRVWKDRELPFELDGWQPAESGELAPGERLAQLELVQRLGRAIEDALTRHQRDVFVAVVLNGAPIDVVAERMGSTRGSIYKTVHDARRKLRAELGLGLNGEGSADGRGRRSRVRERLGLERAPGEPAVLARIRPDRDQ